MKQGMAQFVGLLFLTAVLSTAWNLSAAEFSRTRLKVENLSCSSCLYAINAELQKEEGMVEMDADLRQGLVTVDHGAPLDSARIAGVISNLGYPATVLESAALTEEELKQSRVAGASATAAGCRCSASGSAWKQLYEKYFKNPDKSGTTE